MDCVQPARRITYVQYIFLSQNPALSKLFQVYDMCMDCSKFEATAISSFKKLMRSLGDSNITLKGWNKSGYNIFDTLVKGTQLKFNIFFTTGVRMNPKNSSKQIFFVSENCDCLHDGKKFTLSLQ